jgi:hypothetical protein
MPGGSPLPNTFKPPSPPPPAITTPDPHCKMKMFNWNKLPPTSFSSKYQTTSYIIQ